MMKWSRHSLRIEAMSRSAYWILPGVAGRCEDFFDLERSDTLPNVGAINAVPIPHEIARSFVFGEGLHNLLGSPGCCGPSR
jgi:hypothetical protein